MPVLTALTSREKTLLTGLCRAVGLTGLSESQLKVWLESLRKLEKDRTDDIPADDLVKVMKWAVAHSYWTTRVVNMGNFAFYFDEVYDQYRGDMRKLTIQDREAQQDTPACAALRKLHPDLLFKREIVQAEVVKRFKERRAEAIRVCQSCGGKYWVPSKFGPFKVPCKVCAQTHKEIFQEVTNEVNMEVYGQ